MGAEDYITKPFRARELLSRINSVLRRNKKQNNKNIIEIEGITIDLGQAKVLKDGKDVMLTALEYKILITLALEPNVVFSREQILAEVWGIRWKFRCLKM